MADPIDTYQYLQPDFDSQSLKVAELRRVFLEHDIDYKSTAKKADLVQIFNDKIKPIASQLLRAKQSPIKSSNRIERVGEASPVVLPSEFAATSKTPKRAPGRPRKHPLTDEEPATVVKSGKPSERPTTARRSVGRPRKVPKIESEDDSKSMPQSRSPRKSSATLVADSDADMDDAEESDQATESAFSKNNPFQSGSPRTDPTPVKRRQTAVPNSSQRLAPPINKTDRRQTTHAPSRNALSGSDDESKTLKTPKAINQFRKSERFMPPISSLKASPAFQSAAQRKKENEIASEQLIEKETSTSKSRSRRRSSGQVLQRRNESPSSISRVLKWLPLLALTSAGAYGANWYRDEQIKAGYCGVDSIPHARPVGASDLDNLIHAVRPQCVPCPPHAVCQPGFRMHCDDEFVKRPHPLSFGGLVPITSHCVPDTEKLRKIQIVANHIIETLRDDNAAIECGHKTPQNEDNINGMTESEIKSILETKRSSSTSDSEFNSLFDHALEEIKTRPEIEISSR